MQATQERQEPQEKVVNHSDLPDELNLIQSEKTSSLYLDKNEVNNEQEPIRSNSLNNIKSQDQNIVHETLKNTEDTQQKVIDNNVVENDEASSVENQSPRYRRDKRKVSMDVEVPVVNEAIRKNTSQGSIVIENQDDEPNKAISAEENKPEFQTSEIRPDFLTEEIKADFLDEEPNKNFDQNENLPEIKEAESLKVNLTRVSLVDLIESQFVDNSYNLSRHADTLSINLNKKISVKDNLHDWMITLSENVKSLHIVLEELDSGIRINNKEVSSRHRLLKSFYDYYLFTFDFEVENSDSLLLHKVADLKSQQMDQDATLDRFDKALINIQEAQSKKKNELATYKGKFQKIVQDNYENDLYRHSIIQDWLESIKKIDNTKVDLDLAYFAQNQTLDHFMEAFEQSQYLQNKSKISTKCTHQYSLELKNALEIYQNYINKYCEQLVSIIPKSKSKERQTMMAIRNSFNHFLELTRDIFGPDYVSEFMKSNDDFDKLSNIDHSFATFELKNMLTPEKQKEAAKLCRKNQIYDAKDLTFYSENFLNEININGICDSFVRMQADVFVVEQKFLHKKKNKGAFLCLSHDDIISIYSEKGELIYDFHWAHVSFKETDKTSVNLRIVRKVGIFKKKQDIEIKFEHETDKEAFQYYFEEAEKFYENIKK